MSDDFHEIENALKRLKPRAPSEFCEARIAVALTPHSAWSRRRVIAWASMSSGIVAACLVAAVLVPSFPEHKGADAVGEVASPLATVEIPAQRILSAIEPLEIQQAADGRYFRPYRVQYINTTQTRPEGANVTLVKTVPEEEVQFVAVDMI